MDLPKTKICRKCQVEKPLEEFFNEKNGKYGKKGSCKECSAITTKAYRTSEHGKEMARKNYRKPENRQKQKEYRSKPEVKKRHQEYMKTYRPEYYKRPEVREARRKKQTTPEYRKKAAANMRRKRANPVYNLKHRCNSMIGNAFKNRGYKKSTRTEKILGVSYEVFIRHLTQNGKISPEGMEIDHIIPISWAKTESEVIALNHFTNLRLIKREENKEKSDRCPTFDELPIILPHLAIDIYERNK